MKKQPRRSLWIGGVGLLAAVLSFAPLAGAAEVTVRNDTVENFSQVGIVGDFVAGEQAGARLQSPCDGTLVAVQIVWIEPPGAGTQPSLEQAIHVFADAGTHPIPGTEMLYLEAPLLTAGSINEFRYLDEDNTVPIAEPVSNGQYFYVTLEFANATDVGGSPGTASVVRDTDGCAAGRNVLYGDIGLGYNWYEFCGPLLLQGDLAIRAVIDCPGETGACCAYDASCTDNVEEEDCQDAGETFFSGQSCGEVSCPLPTGACCNGTGGCLDDVTEPTCTTTLASIYAGNGTACDDDVCMLGACCLPDGSCTDVVEVTCVDQGGLFEGPGTTCATTSCPQPLGACCVNGNCIPNQTEVNCSGFGGSWEGAFTDCGPPDPCAAAPGDGDEDGDVDLADFMLFQACHGASATGTCAAFDLNDDDAIDNTDLDLFIAALTGP